MKKWLSLCAIVWIWVWLRGQSDAYYIAPLLNWENIAVDMLSAQIHQYIHNNPRKLTDRSVVRNLNRKAQSGKYGDTISEMLFQIADRISYSHRVIWYAVAEKPTPILHTTSFARVWWGGKKKNYTLWLDEYGTIDEVDMVALPWTIFDVVGKKTDTDGNVLYRVETNIYPGVNKKIYIDSRLVSWHKKRPLDRFIYLPSRETIIKEMKKAIGTPYVRWGNRYQGIDELTTLYPYPKNAPSYIAQQRKLQGVDCSGLLYQATNGYTLRNTRQLITFGKWLNIVWKSNNDIIKMLQPLDIIVWKGHVMIVIDNGNVIESRHDWNTKDTGYKWWTRIITVQKALDIITHEDPKKRPVNKYTRKGQFVIRRRYPERQNIK